MALLKNDGGLLPLKTGSKIAVIGPMEVTQQLQSDYAGGAGEGGCWPKSDMTCVNTIADAIAAANTGGTTTVSAGCDINSKNTSKIAAAMAAANAADITVLVLGNDRSQEHEELDRPDIGLAGVQPELAAQILAIGKPTVESCNPNQNTPELVFLTWAYMDRFPRQMRDVMRHTVRRVHFSAPVLLMLMLLLLLSSVSCSSVSHLTLLLSRCHSFPPFSSLSSLSVSLRRSFSRSIYISLSLSSPTLSPPASLPSSVP